MALDLTAIRKAIASNADGAAGVNDTKHYRPDSAFSGVVFWVEVSDVSPSALGRTRWTVALEGTLLVQGAWDRSKQELVDELLPLVWLAIESDRTLAGAARDVEVRNALVLRDVEDGQPLGVRYDISVEA